MSDSGSFQIIASSLGPRACEILCVSFKSGVSISHSHLFGSPQSKPHWPSKPSEHLALKASGAYFGETQINGCEK